MGDKEKVQKVIQLLSNVQPLLMSTVLKQLVMDGEPVVPILDIILKNENVNLRLKVVTLLGRLGDSSAVFALTDALNDDVLLIRKNALTALVHVFSRMKGTEIFKNIEEVQDFEVKLMKFINNLKKNHPEEKEIRRAQILITKLKLEIAETKNELAGKRDILLLDKPKPPKKGQLFQRLKRIRNG